MTPLTHSRIFEFSFSYEPVTAFALSWIDVATQWSGMRHAERSGLSAASEIALSENHLAQEPG